MKLLPNITAKWLGERENCTILTLIKISVSALKKQKNRSYIWVFHTDQHIIIYFGQYN